MCGIYGVVSASPGRIVDTTVLSRMGRVLRHRGPDDEGYRCNEQAGLGMRRLSIIDLVTGQQPVVNEDGSIWLVFNGEIYNYRELRRTLERRGHVFASKGDTEVIVHAYEEYGDHCVEHFNGMFAFAVWDSAQRRLLLARDRLGIKPLYYSVNQDRLIFGSELKAVIAHPDVPRELDPVALDHFLTLEYIPGPRTILKDVRKLLPGHHLVFQAGEFRVERYWDIPYLEVAGDETTWRKELVELIADAVRLRLVSDVPLGAFLSGGIDSSTIVAFMSQTSTDSVKTFSIGFDDQTYNELPYARTVAATFNTDHYEAVLQPDITALAEQLVGHLDEPLADFSILPTYLVSELARRSVKVVLSGDGGDEVFGGYDTYVAQHLDRFYRRLPPTLRRTTLPWLMNRVPPQSAKKGMVNKFKRFVEGGSLPASLGHTRWMIFMDEFDKAGLYQPEFRFMLNGNTPQQLLEGYFRDATWDTRLGQGQYVDLKTYLVDNILTKVDRMSMAASLEARVPLLDHRIVEFAVNLPTPMKLHRGQTKFILRQAMAGRIPDTVLKKPKQGFSIPLKHWLRGPLRPLMIDLLSTDTVNRRGYFASTCITRWIAEHLEGRANHSHRLWALMVFELWQQQALKV
jgi:asparagine synthase (glutamine-hydrolysing)